MKYPPAIFVFGFWFAAVLLLAGCEPSAPSRNKPGKPGGALPPGFQDLTFDQALSLAKTENKPVMVDISAEWCGPCKKMDADTWTDGKVQGWLKENAIPIKVDFTSRSPEIVKKFDFDSIPVMIFFKPDGAEIGRLGGYHSPEQFLSEAGRLLAGKK
jgi:thiol:disulfide interchange protein